MTALRLAECFGPTLQGEGPSQGRPAAFVRLSGCNLTCQWCDTPYTWDWRGLNGTVYDPSQEMHRTTPRAVAEQVADMGVSLVVITGGEPLAQRSGLVELVAELMAGGARVEIETNGTLQPAEALRVDERVSFNVSPKLSGSGVPETDAMKIDVLKGFAKLATVGRAAFKFVIADPFDVFDVEYVVMAANVPAEAVWLMPEGTTAADVLGKLADLADVCIANGWNLTPRLHTLCWGNRRGM